MGYTPSDKTSLGLTFSYLNCNQGKPPIDNANAKDSFAKTLKYERENNAENYSTQLAFEQGFDNPFSLKGWIFYNQLNLLQNGYDNANYNSQAKKGAYSNNSTTGIGGGNLQARYDLKEFGSATLGFMTESDDWRANGFKLQGSPVVNQSINGRQSFQLYSSLFEYNVMPIQHLGVTLGLGLHWQDRDNGNYDDYSYLIGTYYDLFKDTRIRASNARKIRFPTISDLYDPVNGNPDLKPEESIHYELSLEQRLPAKTLFSLTGFYADAHNFIEQDNSTQINENFDKYRFKGFEVAAENRFVDNLMLKASYTYLDAKNVGSDSNVDQLQYRPRDKYTLEGNYRFSWGASLYASVSYIGNQTYYDQTNTQSNTLPSYTLMDIKLSQSLIPNSLDVYLGARNLFDINYEQSYGLPQAGRTVYGGVEYRF